MRLPRRRARLVPLSTRERQGFDAKARLVGLWLGVMRGAWVVHALATPWAQPVAMVRTTTATVTRRAGYGVARAKPHWWDYESDLKRFIALDAMMKQMFARLSLI